MGSEKLSEQEVAFELAGERLIAHANRGLYWPERNTLFIADIHLGKLHHFRNRGIAVPAQAADHNLERITDLLDYYQPSDLWVLGDLFHSEKNNQWQALTHWLKQRATLNFHLVMGNHDILSPQQYHDAGVLLHHPPVQLGPFLLTHEPMERTIPLGFYNLCGHIHPGVQLRGRGRMGMRVPCFHFGKAIGILPAFGLFTGAMALPVKKQDQVFLVSDGEIITV